MNLVQQVLHHVKNPLDEVEEGIRRVLSDASPEASKVVMHLAESGGKRVRPMLTILTSQLFDGYGLKAVPVGIAAELIHMATLVHDDIIDRAATRRGRETVNSLWGNRVSVLAGDALLAKALVVLIEEQDHPEIVSLMARMIYLMCDGEIHQHETLFDMSQTEEAYDERIEKKTALFFAACCEAGARTGGADEEQVRAMWTYGRHLGMAFQVIDDLLDLSSDEHTVGKPVGSDLASGVITLPVLHALNSSSHGDQIRPIVAKGKQMTTEDINHVISMVEAAGSLEFARQRAEHYVEQAKEMLTHMPDNPTRLMLYAIADAALTRDF